MNNKLLTDRIGERLDGGAKAAALDFVGFCDANGLPINSNNEGNGWAVGGVDGHSLGFMAVEGMGDASPWTLWLNNGDFGGEGTLDEGLKEFAWAHVSVCSKCHDGWENCGPQETTVIGRRFERLCHSPLVFNNPDADDLVKIKALILALKELHLPAILEHIRRAQVLDETRDRMEDEYETVAKPLLAKLDNAPPRGETVTVDVTDMVAKDGVEYRVDDGLLVLRVEGNKGRMETRQKFADAVRIQLRAKTDSTNIRIRYGKGKLTLNWQEDPDEMKVQDICHNPDVYRNFGFKGCGRVPVGEFADIEWVIGRDVLGVKVNGEVRHAGRGYEYIKAYANDPGYAVFSTVSIEAAWGSTVTVESLKVTEI
jgi:hypothetical protein